MQLKRTTLLLMLLLPFLLLQEAWAQGQVKGTVTTASGDPLVSASVLVQGTSRGVLTDDQGGFTIQAAGDDVLLISYIGYEAQQVLVNNRSTISITMEEAFSTTDEVVVIGYGTQGRSQVTNAITKVSAEEISSLPVVSAEQALQGRAAGVTVINNGSPGRGATIRIRGINSVNSNEPLFVIDGVPAGGLSEINPEDIESIEVAKDASATAIYGSRASGGVVFITTKRGKAGKPQVSFDGYYGVQNLASIDNFDLLNTQQYIQYATDIQNNANDPVPPRFTDPGFVDGSAYINQDNNIDYMEEIYRSAPIQDYNVSVKGGTENGRYYVSAGYLNQQGVQINTGFERYSFRVNTDFKAGRFEFGQSLNLAYSHRDNERVSGGRSLNEHAIKMAPYIPVRSEDGAGYRGPDQVDNNDAVNPVRVMEQGEDFDETLKLLGNFYVDLEIVEGLNLRQQVGIDMAFGFGRNFSPFITDGEFHTNLIANLSEGRSDFVSPISTTTLNFDREFGEHNLSVLAGYEVQYSRFRNTNAAGQNELTEDLATLQSFATPSIGGVLEEDQIISYFGRISYNYANRYLLQASIRRDGYSRFGPANKWGLFPSVSAGWNLHNEAFMVNVSGLSTLKIRGSYGEVGNSQALGRYAYQSTVGLNNFYNFNGNLEQGANIRALANEELRWETIRMVNAGIDLGFWNDQLTFTAEYYNTTTFDMLLTVNLPPSMGFDGSPFANTGDVTSSGLEFSLGYNSDPTRDFTYSIKGNFATQANEVLSLGEGNPINGPGFEGDVMTRVDEGESIFYFFGWETMGLFQESDFVNGELREGIPTQTSAQPGDIRFADLAGPLDENGNPTGPDGIIDVNDRTNLGSPLPNFIYGLNADFGYKNFTLNLFFQGQGGNQIYNTNRYDLEGMTRVFNAGTAVLDRWTPTNTDTDIPRGVTGDPNRNSRVSNRFLEDGDFLRLKLARLGYNVDVSNVNWISRLNVYVASQNLLTFTNYTGLDPEIGRFQNQTNAGGGNAALGIDYGQYPQPRTFMVGVQANF